MTTAGAGLHVLRFTENTERWRDLVADVGRLLGTAPFTQPRPRAGQGSDEIQAVLVGAAQMDGAVLVLPDASAPESDVGGTGPRLRRVLVPFDRSPGEGPVLRPVIDRALAEGLAVEQVHVLTEESRPTMWEGAGHHARAWYDELRRRHQIGTSNVKVQNGQPGHVLSTLAGQTDLVVVCWNGQVSTARAHVLREILASKPPPLLLLRSVSADTSSRDC